MNAHSKPQEIQAIDEEFEIEPVAGLPEALPAGEKVLWSAEPDWKAVALDVFHIRAIALYAVVLVAWRVVAGLYDGAALGVALQNAVPLGLTLALGLMILGALAFATAKSTRYTITNKRVAMRIGVALTMTVNLPFTKISAADYRDAPFGTGAIALALSESGGLGYLVLWPHARPFRFAKPQPMLRGIKDGERVARMLAAQLRAVHGGEPASAIHVTPAPTAQAAA